MVPTSSPFADRSVDPKSGKSEEDFYLHLHLPPELDLPLPATTQIYHQPPRSYLIPRWDLGRDSGAFTRIEFPELGSRRHIQEDVDTFETILAQCTAFLERAPPPKLGVSSSSKGEKSGFGDEKAAARSMETGVAGPSSSKSKAALAQEPPPYNPNDFQPGEAYARGSHSKQQTGQIVLIDEEDGSVIGELGEGMTVIEHQALQPGSKGERHLPSFSRMSFCDRMLLTPKYPLLVLEPVEITLPTDSTQNISVAPASKESVEMLMHPAYQKSFLVSNASMASRFIVGTSDKVSSMLQSGATAITAKSKPASKPMTFKPATHERIRRINTFTGGAVGLSTKTVGQIGKVAQNVGATLARKGHKGGGKGFDKDGNPIDGYKPGLLNKSLMAFSTVADGIEQAGKTLLTSTSNAATTVVEHKWGPEAGDVSRNLGSGVKNVGLVYIDVTGVSRRALVKNVAKGMIVGKAPNGKDVIVGGGDGGVVPVPPEKRLKDSEGNGTSSSASSIKGYSDDKKAAIEYK